MRPGELIERLLEPAAGFRAAELSRADGAEHVGTPAVAVWPACA
jgi:hypothetical protein